MMAVRINQFVQDFENNVNGLMDRIISKFKEL